MSQRFVISFAAILESLSASAADVPASVRTALETHCVGCHNADEKKSGLDLTALKPDFADAEVFARWVKVHDRVAAGEMRPPKKTQPSTAERNELTRPLASPRGELGRFRHLLWVVGPTRDRRDFNNALYGEFDVYARP